MWTVINSISNKKVDAINSIINKRVDVINTIINKVDVINSINNKVDVINTLINKKVDVINSLINKVDVINSFINKVKVKVIPQQADVAQGFPLRLRHGIFLMLGTTRMVGRLPYAPAAFTPG